MPNLLDYTENTDAGHESALNEHRLKKEPSMTILFTQECEEAKLHYESDEAIRSYIQCPGDHCPLCYIGSTPNTFLLLPIYCIETGEVEVLRISQKRGPGTLLGGLRPYLKDPDITDKLLMISREGPRYKIQSRSLDEKADRGVIEIEAFKRNYERGLKLISAFPRWAPEDLAGLDRIRKKLNALGGYDLSGESDDEAEEEEGDEDPDEKAL